MTIHGWPDEEWRALVDETRRFLLERARLERSTSYTELNATLKERTGRACFDFARAEDRANMGHLLGEVSKDAVAAGQPMLSAIVIYLNENDAGSGFYQLAQDLGLLSASPSATAKLEFWVDQVKSVYREFG
jgi:hypothetical protein